jgi:uncharacterized protein (TIGR02246 family)
MNLTSLALATTLSLCAMPALAQPSDARLGAEAILARFTQAWSAADGHALAALFAPDADLITPYGDLARGRDEIDMFYSSAFKRGYAGSQGTGELFAVRMLAPDLAIIDARWQITGGRNPEGTPRAEERGILAAVIGKSANGWQILALRENASATEFKPIQ